MLASGDHRESQLAPGSGAHAPPDSGAQTSPYLCVPLAAVPHLGRLRGALGRYRSAAAPAELEAAFAAATALVAMLAGPEPSGRPDLGRMRELVLTVPELGELVSYAADAAECALRTATTGLWDALGLRSAAPSWSEAERETARIVFACACAPAAATSPARLRRSLRAIGAARFAVLLTDQLGENEGAWRRALAERYESVRHRCARRTTWRHGGLAELVRGDACCREAVVTRLARWLTDGAGLAALGSELEAALVHARTPARIA